MGEHSSVIKSTTDLTPDGLLGYAKGMAATIAAVLIAVVEFLPEGQYQRWTQIAIAILGAITTIAVPNKVQPVIVDVPSAGPPPPTAL